MYRAPTTQQRESGRFPAPVRFKSSRYGVARVAAAAAVVALSPSLVAVTSVEAIAEEPSVGTTTELPELSTATSDTVREADGSLTTTSYASPVNYQDDQGDWETIDNSLVDAPGPQYDVQNAANSFTAKIPVDPASTPIKFSEDGSWVTMQMNGIADAPAVIDDDTAVFPELAKADSVAYRVTDTGLKEEIALESAPATPLHFTYAIDASQGLTPTIQDDGSILFADESAAVKFVIPPGVMHDSQADPEASDAVSYQLRDSDSGWTLTVTPDYEWLTSEVRTYPVVIDPSLTNQTASKDCTLQSFSPDSVHCGDGTAYLKAGRSDSTHKYRGVFNFDLSAIPADARVTGSTVHLVLDPSQTYDRTKSDVYGIFEAGKKFNGQATWNSTGTGDSWSGGAPSGSAIASKTLTGDPNASSNATAEARDKGFGGFASIAQRWVSDPSTNSGLVLKQVSESTNDVLSFYSSASSNGSAKKPHIEVNYTNLVPGGAIYGADLPVGTVLTQSDLTALDVDTALLDQMSDGELPIPAEQTNPPTPDPSNPDYEDTPEDDTDESVAGATVPQKTSSLTELRATETSPSAQVAPSGSYRILSHWDASDGKNIVYRVGYYMDPLGFGDAKLVIHHNINEDVAMATTKYPQPGGIQPSGTHSWNYLTTVNHVRCSGWWIFKSCKVIGNAEVKIVVNMKQMRDGQPKGVVNGYCLNYNPFCPDWVKDAINI